MNDGEKTLDQIRRDSIQERAVILADQDLQALRALRKAPWFTSYFIRRLNEEREKRINKLAYDSLIEDVPAIKAEIKLLDYLIQMPDSDRKSCWSLLHPDGKPWKEDQE